MVTVECIESKKSEGQTSKQTNKQTNQRRRKDYSRRVTITNKPTKQKDYTSPALAGAGDYKKHTNGQTNGDNHPKVAVRL